MSAKRPKILPDELDGRPIVAVHGVRTFRHLRQSPWCTRVWFMLGSAPRYCRRPPAAQVPADPEGCRGQLVGVVPLLEYAHGMPSMLPVHLALKGRNVHEKPPQSRRKIKMHPPAQGKFYCRQIAPPTCEGVFQYYFMSLVALFGRDGVCTCSSAG